MTKKQSTISIVNQTLTDLLSNQKPPCLSLYQPTHRQHPDNKQDLIRFHNLVKELEASLSQKYPASKSEALLEPFKALGKDADFWEHTLDGLVILAGTGFFHVMRLQQKVSQLVVVADTFHTKPLRRFLQSADRYQVLGLSLDKICFFEGNRYSLDEIDLVPGVPRTITDALGGELTEPHLTVASYGGIGGSSGPMHHGQGNKNAERDIDAERFFRAVDRAVLDHYSRPSGLPLILSALPEHHHLFYKVSQNPHLVQEGIPYYPDSLPAEKQRNLAWQVIEPQYLNRLAALNEEFKQGQSSGMSGDDLTAVAQAAIAGRVSTLLIEADRQIPGRLNGVTGQIELADLSNPQVDDLLDDLGELVSNNGGRVLVVPSEQMPTETGLAAIYLY